MEAPYTRVSTHNLCQDHHVNICTQIDYLSIAIKPLPDIALIFLKTNNFETFCTPIKQTFFLKKKNYGNKTCFNARRKKKRRLLQ